MSLSTNLSILQNYNSLDSTGKVHHQSWLNNVAKIYIDEPSMKTSLLYALMEFTLSWYKEDISAPASPKQIAFFQILHALNLSIYRFFSKKIGRI